MLTTSLEKIDKFIVILTLVLITMAVMVIFTFRGIFGAFLTAYEFDQSAIGKEVQLNKEGLDEAHAFVFNRSTEVLRVRD